MSCKNGRSIELVIYRQTVSYTKDLKVDWDTRNCAIGYGSILLKEVSARGVQ